MVAILRTCAILVLLGCTAPAAGQTSLTAAPEPAQRRFDIGGLAGWFGEHRVETGAEYFDDWNNRWYGSAVAGWYGTRT